MYYGVTSWGNAALIYTHKIQIQLNNIVKIITRTSFFKTILSPLYIQLNLIKLKDIYELEVLKFVYELIKNYLPKWFHNYFLPASNIHNYLTRFASEYNWVTVMRCSKTLSLGLIKIKGRRVWNSLPEEIKNKYHLNNKVLFNKLKKILIKNNVPL